MIDAEFEIVVERGKIKEFALATSSHHPAYQCETAVSPITYLTVADWVWGPMSLWRDELFAEIGFDPQLILHAEQEYVFHAGMPRAGDRLTGRIYLDDQYEKLNRNGRTLRFVKYCTAFSGPDGALVAEQFTTTVERPRSESVAR